MKKILYRLLALLLRGLFIVGIITCPIIFCILVFVQIMIYVFIGNSCADYNTFQIVDWYLNLIKYVENKGK